MSDREVIYEIIVRAWAESGNQPVVVETAERIAKEIIEAGFISLKESSDMARETCDILRRIKDDEIYRVIKERDSFANCYYIAKLALDAMSDTLLNVEG